MAYNKVSDATIRRVCKTYGDNSVECRVIHLVRDARLPYECIAEVMKCETELVKQDLTGQFKLDEPTHNVMIRFLTTIIPLGIERGVLPCKDNALTSSVLRLLIELCGYKQHLQKLQEQINSLQQNN